MELIVRFRSTATRSSFYILWALNDGANHGYAIICYFKHRKKVRAKIGLGTLNRNLPQMADLGLIEKMEVSEPQPRGSKYYRITQRGRRTLLAHLQCMEEEIESVKMAHKSYQRRRASERWRESKVAVDSMGACSECIEKGEPSWKYLV